jgi:phospholipid/cholesterol/gamma-HCH transport system substrate-binding protein
MQIGTAVLYRGVPVGRVVDIEPTSNLVKVLVEITESDLRIPNEVRIEANQSGFIGETTIDITPLALLTETEQALNPNAPDCDEFNAIICDGDRLDGQIGVSYESLLRSAEALANTLTDPVLIEDLKNTLKNAAVFTERATRLTDELTTLTLSAQGEIEPLSESVQRASNNTAAAAQEFQLTAADVRTLIDANRLNLTSTLDNIAQGSDRLVVLVDSLAAQVEDTDFLDNLEVLAENAAAASVNLRAAAVDVQAITGSLNQPENLLLLQQTLESARDVFQSAQKILADVDELTGDPAIRNSIRDLIYGLSNLLSSTEILEQQTELAATLAPLQGLTASEEGTPPTVDISLPASDYQALQQQLQELAAMTDPTETPAP